MLSKTFRTLRNDGHHDLLLTRGSDLDECFAVAQKELALGSYAKRHELFSRSQGADRSVCTVVTLINFPAVRLILVA